MYKTRPFVALVLAAFVASTFAGPAHAAGFLSPAAGGPLARLNRPLVPMATLPGVPTASPLGLIAPRLSLLVTTFQKGGLGTSAGRIAGLGVLSPRISPVAGLVRAPSLSRQAQLMYGLTILSPRAAVLVGMLKGARGLTSFVR